MPAATAVAKPLEETEITDAFDVIHVTSVVESTAAVPVEHVSVALN